MFNLFRKREIPHKSLKEIKFLSKILKQINENESWAKSLKKEAFPHETLALKEAYTQHKNINLLIPKAFALAREAAFRTLGERMFEVQILGGLVLHQGRIAEMKTGEGKTLTSTAAAYLNSLTGNPVHMVTVNDYLAKRDSEWMSPVFHYLGQSTGYIISNMPIDIKRDMYARDIIYATNNELGFDYLRDNLRIEKEAVCKRGYHYCIIDEIDSVLIDEARTPLIISGPAADDTKKFKQADALVSFLQECSKDPATDQYPEDAALLDADYKLDKKNKTLSFTTAGTKKIEKMLNNQNIIQGSIEDIEHFEYIHYANQAVRAHTLFAKDVDYIINDNKVEIVDEFTGRVLKGRRYSDGLHQAIEAKEGIKVERQNRTLASVTFQNFFRMYTKLSGMTGTAVTEEKEFIKIYGLDVVEIPTNRPVIRADHDDLIYVNEQTKNNAILQEVQEVYGKGQPLLIGTASIESSEQLSSLLKKNHITHKVLNAKNHEHEATIIAEAGKKHAVTIATNMAGRGTDIKLGGNLDFRIQSRISALEDPTPEEVLSIRAEEIAQWQDAYIEVKQLGGLYVLGTERHESRRIDNQLRGRSGRQGDPGVSQFFLSLDDQLMKLFGQGLDRLRSLMSRMLDAEESLSHPLISNTMERAQKNVEYRNFEIRKHLLNFDEVLNSQKNQIYSQREDIIMSQSLVQRLQKNIQENIEYHAKKFPADQQQEVALSFVKDTLRFSSDTNNEIEAMPPQDLITLLQEDITHKADLIGQELFNNIVRIEYLKTIDSVWQEHITQLEELRQAVYLRSYAQKNPLLEYKLESYKMFDDVIENISINILRKFVGLRADNIHIQHETKPQPLILQQQHISMLSNSQNNASPASPTPQSSKSIPSALNTVPKVGRNDPCPCGSGKKYKHCHGKIQ